MSRVGKKITPYLLPNRKVSSIIFKGIQWLFADEFFKIGCLSSCPQFFLVGLDNVLILRRLPKPFYRLHVVPPDLGDEIKGIFLPRALNG
jgi:hypothetical protein